MEVITVKTHGEKLKALIAFLKAMEIPFFEEDLKMSKDEFFQMIDNRKKEARNGKTIAVTKELQNKLFEV